MKKLFLIIALAMVLTGCTDYTDDINAINNRLDKLEKEIIPSISGQISAINTSLDNLKTMDKELKGYIDNLSSTATNLQEQINATNTEIDNKLAQIYATIEALKTKDSELNKIVTDLKSYVDNELSKTTDWANATFATLEQFNSLSIELTNLKTLLEEYKNSAADNLSNAISTLETSMKAWLGEQLSNYYTIAEVDAKITALQAAITEGDVSLQDELNELKSQLETTANEITVAYKKAIEEAINTNDGVINAKIANEIAAVNQRIDSEVATINAKITTLQAQVNKNTTDIAKLLARIQSVSYIPTYSDGKATVKHNDSTNQVTLDFEISPKDAVAELAKVWEKAVSVKAVYTQTRAISFIEMPIITFEADIENGVISVIASGENLSSDFFACMQEASARIAISDGNNSITSDYIPLVAKEIMPFNEIWYTSTDSGILMPYDSYGTEAFGAIILSNTYKNGKGVIKFNKAITSIGEHAFLLCNSLASITIPESVTSIGKEAFYECKGLTSVTIPDSVTEIGRLAFSGCSGLKSFYGKFASKDNRCLIVRGVLMGFAPAGLTSYTIPNNVTSIEKSTFYDYTNLTNIIIPDSVTEIGDYAFNYCSGLTSITLSKNITSIGYATFANCWSLLNITIPESVTEIGYSAFTNCRALTSITIPKNVNSIGEYAFNLCSGLTTVYCKPTTPPIGSSNMFNSNSSGRKIYVPASSTSAYKTARNWSNYASYIEGYNF